jgi:ribosomal protein L37E
MTHYTQKWTATCPRCGNRAKPSDYTCDNCGHPEIRVNNYGSKIYDFGCPNCRVLCGAPRCRCGTSLGGVARVTGFHLM